ncbi:MAG: PorP/SprF family type IX secretion system membrane protein [Paludibacteraceae bacterium]|nr:PorP/SprF family type IX secretion system membrane protein [Paludibacteraceae bacterium]
MRLKKYLVLAALALCGSASLFAQEELVYDQYHFNYYLVNPALAGAEACTHFMLTNKFQWVGMDDFPMTQVLTAKGRISNVGLGGYLYNDRNGYSNRIGGQFTFAYHIPLSKGRQYTKRKTYDRQLSFGVSFKFNYFYINSKLFDEDANALADPAFAEDYRNGWAPNANFGVYYKSYGAFVGLSMTNLIPMRATLYGSAEDPAPFTTFLFGGYTFDLQNNNTYLEPMLMLKMDAYLDIAMDLNVKFGQDVSKKWGYWVQASYRHSWDAGNIQAKTFMPMFGFRIQKFQIAYAFTLDLNSLITQSAGTHELMLGYTFCYQKHFCR